MNRIMDFTLMVMRPSVLSHRRAHYQRVLAGCTARRASAGLAVANSNEHNAAERPPALARREPFQ